MITATTMHKYVVETVAHITASTLLLSLKKPAGERPLEFQAGQYAAISLYHRHRPTPARCFSMVSSPSDPEILQFSMREKGHFTRAVAALTPGDIINVRGPYGGFVIDDEQDTDIVCLAGGIGITPFMSMVRYTAAVRSSSKLTLIYSCATQDDIPFFEELKSLQLQMPNFKVIFMIGHGPIDKLVYQVTGMGRITPELLDALWGGQYGSKTFFICGPPLFMNGMVKTLRGKGVDRVQILTEAFAQGSHRQSSLFRSWPRSVYALGTAGFAVGSLAIMASDLIKTLPPSTYLGTSNISTKATLTSSRQADLDALVNNLPLVANASPASSAATAAIVAATAPPPTPVLVALAPGSVAKAVPKAASAAAPRSGFPAAATPAPAPAPAAAPAPTAAPMPAPTPPPKHCTTTQSGVTTCI